MEHGVRCTASGASGLTTGTRRAGGAFTLVEMLIVIAMVAILTTLIAPSLSGLFGVVGRRGGANAINTALDQARLAAIESGVPAFVFFPQGISNDLAWSSLIVMRERRDDETPGTGPIPLSRWIRLPEGVFVEPASLAAAVNYSTNASAGIPKLNNIQVSSFRGFAFDRFGRLSGAAATTTPPEIKVGEGLVNGDSLVFRRAENDYSALAIKPLTGRVKVTDGLQSN